MRLKILSPILARGPQTAGVAANEMGTVAIPCARQGAVTAGWIIESYIDIPALQAAYRRYLSQPMRTSDADFFTIFLSVNLALWLQHSGLIP